jgi:hypothetical protein
MTTAATEKNIQASAPPAPHRLCPTEATGDGEEEGWRGGALWSGEGGGAGRVAMGRRRREDDFKFKNDQEHVHRCRCKASSQSLLNN